jgi:hypothetical protein
MDEYYTLESYKLPSESSKDIDVEGNPYDPSGNVPSEWAWASTVCYFKSGKKVLGIDIDEKVNEYMCQQLLDSMMDKGLMHSAWDEEKGEIVYQATDKGIKAVEDGEYRESD